MADHITIYINNNAEYLLDKISYDEIKSELPFLHRLGDRSILWKGNNKLIITSLPIPHLDYWKKYFNNNSIINLYPKNPTISLSDDILVDKNLFDKIISYCNRNKVVKIIPYGTTYKFLFLIAQIKSTLDINQILVELPESPKLDNLWFSSYFNSKVGFRHMMGEWFGNQFPCHLPEGYIASDHTDLLCLISHFLANNKACICKPSTATSGMGQIRIFPEKNNSEQNIEQKINPLPYMWKMPIIVEELIQPKLFPSGEAYIPPNKSGKINITYFCNQIFTEKNFFQGIVIDQNQFSESLTNVITKCLNMIGKKLQNFGYIGLFDLDFIVGKDNKLYLLEANLRRTGGTHVHETAELLFGKNYIHHKTVISADHNFQNPIEWNELIKKLDTVMFPLGNNNEGLIITRSSFIPDSFSYMIFGNNYQKAKYLQAVLFDLLSD